MPVILWLLWEKMNHFNANQRESMRKLANGFPCANAATKKQVKYRGASQGETRSGMDPLFEDFSTYSLTLNAQRPRMTLWTQRALLSHLSLRTPRTHGAPGTGRTLATRPSSTTSVSSQTGHPRRTVRSWRPRLTGVALRFISSMVTQVLLFRIPIKCNS